MSKKNQKHILISLFLLLILPACTPKPLWLAQTPAGPPEFMAGWDDGCHSGMATVSTSYYKSHYRFKQNVQLISDNSYFNAWRDGFSYCKDYTDKWTFKSWDTFFNTDPGFSGN